MERTTRTQKVPHRKDFEEGKPITKTIAKSSESRNAEQHPNDNGNDTLNRKTPNRTNQVALSLTSSNRM